MSKEQIYGGWLDWLKKAQNQGCSDDELFQVLRDNGFSELAIKNTVADLASGTPLLSEATQEGDYINALPRLTDPESGLNAMQLVTTKLQLYILDDFLDEEKCDLFINIVESHMQKSILTQKIDDEEYRTSSSSYLSQLAGDKYKKEVDWLESEIATTLGISQVASEGIQAQHYAVGQQYKEHRDIFEPGSNDYKRHASRLGQRTWTFIVYLNDVTKGGGTKFFGVDQVFMPKRGRAIVWNNLYPDGTINYDTLHAGLPVEEGKKVILTKWFRTLMP